MLERVPATATNNFTRRPPALHIRIATALTLAMRLPTFETAGMTLLKRATLVIRDGAITRVFYPVFPPDRSATDVVSWLKTDPQSERTRA